MAGASHSPHELGRPRVGRQELRDALLERLRPVLAVAADVGAAAVGEADVAGEVGERPAQPLESRSHEASHLTTINHWQSASTASLWN